MAIKFKFTKGDMLFGYNIEPESYTMDELVAHLNEISMIVEGYTINFKKVDYKTLTYTLIPPTPMTITI